MSIKKNYYDDPEYREKHLKYMKKKVQCKCGTITARCNMHHHKKTAKHQKFIKNNNNVEKMAKYMIPEQVEKLIKYIKKIDIKI